MLLWNLVDAGYGGPSS